MSRFALCGFLVALAACAKTRPAAKAPTELQFAHPPIVRVKLRSLGERNTLLLRGPTVSVEDNERTRNREKKTLLALDGDRFLLDGEPLAGDSVTVRARDGLVQIDDAAYSGHLVCRREGASIVVINHVPMENYVLGVLRGEIPLPKVSPAAAGAQAVAVRSYTLYYMTQEPSDDFDLDDTTLFQRYVGFKRAPDDESLRKGVIETAGLYLAVDGVPLKAYYHSTCGGYTTDPKTGLDPEDPTPLVGVRCDHCWKSKYYRWSTVVGEDAVLKAAALTGSLQEFKVARSDGHGRARVLLIRSDAGVESLEASTFRLAVGPSTLRSTRIQAMKPVEGGVRVDGGGWGHGVGMCQMGALGLGEMGRTDEEIVRYYYPNADLRKAY